MTSFSISSCSLAIVQQIFERVTPHQYPSFSNRFTSKQLYQRQLAKLLPVLRFASPIEQLLERSHHGPLSLPQLHQTNPAPLVVGGDLYCLNVALAECLLSMSFLANYTTICFIVRLQRPKPITEPVIERTGCNGKPKANSYFGNNQESNQEAST